jgi:NAD(P)-dependent dehydrogenase (short-subunit alcohol dehydrogenase family)
MEYRTLFDLDGEVALVTGGARGIGLAIAEALAKWGARVILVDINGRGEEATARLRAAGADAHYLACDVTDAKAVEALLDRVLAEHGRLDILVNNAGISARIPAEHYPDDALDAMIDLNLKAVFYAMRGAARRWIMRGTKGRIVNLASFAGIVADPMSAPYAATKGAVVQLTRTCAVEWAPHGIRVNAIAPGYVRTEMTARTLDMPETSAAIRARTPLGRPAAPEEIAGAALYLASEASSYVTGHVLMVDGGWTAQ